MSALGRSVALRAPAAARADARAARGLVVAVFATALLVALGFSTLRNEIIGMRYRAAEVLREERALEENRRALAVRVRRLRDPRRLAALARERGFVRPEHVVSLGSAPEAPAR